MKYAFLYLRLGILVLAACSWNRLVAQLTPYYVNDLSFSCTPNKSFGVCRDELTASDGLVAAVDAAYCINYNNTTPPLEAEAQVSSINCDASYLMIATAYETPQPGDNFHYAISANGYTSSCTPDSYAQSACDSLYTTRIGGCRLSPC
jgi:hypothetical protein